MEKEEGEKRKPGEKPESGQHPVPADSRALVYRGQHLQPGRPESSQKSRPLRAHLDHL
jgi:hypothetical protein